ncbi:unnamed protein product [Camellia sinensis]
MIERSHIWSQKMKKEDTVKLISADGFEFVIDKKAAMVSQTIRNMLTSPGSFAETQHGEVTFPEISTTILEKICQYFHWSLQYASGKETEFHIEPELTLELMMCHVALGTMVGTQLDADIEGCYIGKLLKAKV